MRERPIGELAEMLGRLGSRMDYGGAAGFPPVRIRASGLAGGLLGYTDALSSQFLSAILMAAPYARHELQVDLGQKPSSWPYIEMTMRLMDVFGLTPELVRDPLTGLPKRIIVPRGVYQQTVYAVEPDASNATYFLAAAALSPGSRLTVRGLGKNSLQGDVGFAKVLARMGARVSVLADSMVVEGPDRLAGIDVDLTDMPDTAQTLAVTAVFAEGPTTIRGLHSLRVKETDRLAAVATELAKLGAGVRVEDCRTLHIEPPARPMAAAIDTYDDHRMAMSFALAGTRVSGVVIRDAGCTAKTYPGFFADLERLRGD
jgi:3-phosphoshikimate 1-carboxyvinyltransferase